MLTAVALRNRHALLRRNLGIVERNLPLLEEFFARHPDTFDWVRPVASPIGFPRVRGVRDVGSWCERLAHQGVLLLPGSVYDEPDHVRSDSGAPTCPRSLAVLESALAAPAVV